MLQDHHVYLVPTSTTINFTNSFASVAGRTCLYLLRGHLECYTVESFMVEKTAAVILAHSCQILLLTPSC